MSNTLLTSTIITRKALMILHNKLTLIGNMNRQYDKQYAQSGAKIGDTLNLRLPNQYVIRRGKTLVTQDTTERKVPLQVNNQAGVDLTFSSAELTLSIDDFADRYLEPAMAVVAATMESDAATMYKDVYQQVGTAGTVPNTLKTYLQGRAKLNNALAPMDNNRTAHLSTTANVEIVDALKGLFQDSKAISEQYREGKMGRTAGFDWYENPLIPTHTNGTKVAGVTVNGANQTVTDPAAGQTLAVGGVANTNTLTKGSVFTIANVFRVHPETKAVTADLQQFVVTADVTMTGTTGNLAISPGICITGPFQNCSVAPADTAALTFTGSASTGYEQQLLFHRDAFAFATADLVLPKGVHFAAREVYDGISMRIIQQYDINGDNMPCRVDVLYGYKCIRPSLACRVTS